MARAADEKKGEEISAVFDVELPALLPAGTEAAIEPDPAAALGRLLDAPPGGRAVVTGSMVLVGAVRKLLRRRFGAPAPVC